MTTYCFLRNVVNILHDGITAYQRRFGQPFRDHQILCGAEVEYYPINPADKKKLHTFDQKTLTGVFLGYGQQAGGGYNDELEILDCQEVHNATHKSRINIRRMRDTEVIPVKTDDGAFRFPFAEGLYDQPNLSHDKARRLRVRRHRRQLDAEPIPDVPDSTSDPPPQHSTEPQDDPATRQHDFWTCANSDMLIRHHKVPRTELFVPNEDDCPMSLKYLDVMRKTETNSEDLTEHTVTDYWTDPTTAHRELSSEWTGRTIFTIMRPPAPEGKEWVSGSLVKIQKTSRPPLTHPELWRNWSKQNRAKDIAAWRAEEPKRRTERERRGIPQGIQPDDIDDFTRQLAQQSQASPGHSSCTSNESGPLPKARPPCQAARSDSRRLE